MKIKKQIEIVKTLTEAVYEMGEYQRGWEKEIEKGEKLLEYLEEIEKIRSNILIKGILDNSVQPNKNENVRVRLFVNDANDSNKILTETIWISSKSIKLIK